MSENPTESQKESLLGILGLEEGWKSWLRPSLEEQEEESKQGPVKNEPIKEELTILVSDIVDTSLTVLEKKEIGMLEEEPPDKAKNNQDNKTHKLNQELEYEKICVKDYSSSIVKEEPMDDLASMFNESLLNYERIYFHQKIFNSMLKSANQLSKEELEEMYMTHLRNVADIEIFKCSICQYETTHDLNLKSHFLVIHNNQSMESSLFKCSSCCYTCKTQKCMLKHVLNHRQLASSDEENVDNLCLSDVEVLPKRKSIKEKIRVKKDYCDLCDFKSENPKALIKHRNRHRNPEDRKSFLCYKCPYENKNKWKLKKHLLNAHQVITPDLDKLKKIKCEFCDYKTDLRNSLQVHLLKHKAPEDIELFYCDLCDFKTKYKINLKSHMLIHRPDEVTKKFMCEICSTRFRTRSKLKIHLLTHKSIDEVDRVFKCGECEYQTKSKSNLKTHMEIHQEPMYQCDVCGLQSRRKYNHDRHLLSHKTPDQVQMHKCSICHYQTKFKAYLKGHIKKKHSGTQIKSKARLRLENHKGPIFFCNTCGLQSIRKWNYEKHLLTHLSPEEIPMLKCYICHYETKFKDYLKTHLKKIHNVITPSEKKQGTVSKTGKAKKRKLAHVSETQEPSCLSVGNNIAISIPQ